MLVTLNEAKTYLGIPLINTTYDTFLTEQIDIVSEAIESYCKRKFNIATYQQTLYWDDYEKSKTLDLYMYPVTSVTSVEEDGVIVSPTDYRLNKGSGVLTKTSGYFFSAKETVVIYEAGYSVLPMPVRSAVYSILEERYNKKISGISLNFGSDVQRVSIPGTISIDFDYTLQNNERASGFGTILGNQINILDYYRSHRSLYAEGKLIYLG